VITETNLGIIPILSWKIEFGLKHRNRE